MPVISHTICKTLREANLTIVVVYVDDIVITKKNERHGAREISSFQRVRDERSGTLVTTNTFWEWKWQGHLLGSRFHNKSMS